MVRLSEILKVCDRLAPFASASSWDRVGLLVGDPSASVSSILVSLDHSLAAIEKAKETGAELIITHHPLFFEPLKALTPQKNDGRTALALARSGLNLVAMHTNWDCAMGGVNDALAAKLQLENVAWFGESTEREMLKVVVTVPSANAEEVIAAAAKAGAGALGNYDHCSFTSEGIGTFRPLEGSNPAIGSRGTLERVPEARVELLVKRSEVNQVDGAIRDAHPYEEPAIDWYRLANSFHTPIGRIGELRRDLTLAEFQAHLDAKLGTRALVWGDANKRIRKVAVIGGAACSMAKDALSAGADAFVTGEVKQHNALESSQAGLAIAAAGHYATEQPGMAALAEQLQRELPDLAVKLFEPEVGQSGRPL